MREIPWDRRAGIVEVRDRIWSYVSPASQPEIPGLLTAAALLKWPAAEALRLGELQFLLCEEVGDFLSSLPTLLRQLPTASARAEQRAPERLDGPVVWNRTHSLRGITGNPHVFVTAPAERVYQTPENELLVHVLDAVVRTANNIGWTGKVGKKIAAQRVRARRDTAIMHQSNQVLSGITRVEPSPRSVAQVRSGRHRDRSRAVLRAYDRLVPLVEQVDKVAIREAIEQAGLVTSVESTLFELLVTFRVIDSLQKIGWKMKPFYVFKGKVQSNGAHDDGRQISLWYQSTPPALGAASAYKQVLRAHSFTNVHELRPDLSLHWRDASGQDRWLLIECKLGEQGATAARRALVDMLAYRRAFNSALAAAGQPFGLGVAWGAGLTPAVQEEVVLCTPDTLGQAVEQIVL
ncbi:hypothetical protein AB0C27_34095 [Nonomuraea sp. NPDC048882]|uniref:hypothetical protein n=1 Tax=Nonomuraea sp. NPDC048882 TaxID=3154347 RepID=UPI0033DF8DEC